VAERQMTFVDTNVLVYAYDRSETREQPVVRARLEALWRERTGALSTQVLQVFYVVATRKLPAPMQRTRARRLVALYAAWPVVQVDVTLISPQPSWRHATRCRSGMPSSSRQPGAPAPLGS